MLIVLIEA